MWKLWEVKHHVETPRVFGYRTTLMKGGRTRTQQTCTPKFCEFRCKPSRLIFESAGRTPPPTLLSCDSCTEKKKHLVTQYCLLVCMVIRDRTGVSTGVSTILIYNRQETWHTMDIRPSRYSCTFKSDFWAPKSTWMWKSVSVSNRVDWMIQIEPRHKGKCICMGPLVSE
jgi:hypothetical protein